MLNFNQLRVFCQTARYLSCTKAAEKLYITQPAVTAQLKLLEDSCNLKLFKKKGRRIFLTDEGKTLYDYAAKVFEYEKKIESVIEEMKELKRGVLRLGTSKAYARYFMPFLITSFRDAYPHIKIHLDEGSSLDIIHSLLDLRNEVAVIAMAEESPNITFIPFSHEELVLITAPDHRLARRKTVLARDLKEEPIIMKEKGSGTRKLVNELFAKKGLTPNILMETSNTEFIKQVIQRGDGISFVVREAVAAVSLMKSRRVSFFIENPFQSTTCSVAKKVTISSKLCKPFIRIIHISRYRRGLPPPLYRPDNRRSPRR